MASGQSAAPVSDWQTVSGPDDWQTIPTGIPTEVHQMIKNAAASVPNPIPPQGQMPFSQRDLAGSLFANSDKFGKLAAAVLLPEAAGIGTGAVGAIGSIPRTALAQLAIKGAGQAVAGGTAAAINGAGPSGIAGAAALGAVAPAAINAIPRTARAGASIAAAERVADPLSVNPNVPGNVVADAMKLQAAGQTMPRVMQRFIQRVTDPAQGPLTFDEARDFLKTAGRLSAAETTRLTPEMGRLLGRFWAGLGREVSTTAEAGGVGDLYQSGMNEYRQAQQLKNATKAAVKYGAAPATGAALTDALIRRYTKTR